ncbi:MAG: hypothetical protein KGQ37_05515 [Hyphomicrobiales bacterium]|nr:hypothetical protein [Hyphomicrobiales bacterium]
MKLVLVVAASLLSPHLSGGVAPHMRMPCVAPPVPACLQADPSRRSGAQVRACKSAIEREVAALFQWRACTNAEVERHVQRANDAIDRFRCEVAHRHDCKAGAPNLQGSPQ